MAVGLIRNVCRYPDLQPVIGSAPSSRLPPPPPPLSWKSVLIM